MVGGWGEGGMGEKVLGHGQITEKRLPQTQAWKVAG